MERGSAANEISCNVKLFKFMSLYNGARFPEYIFKERMINIIFFDFHVCFSDDFIFAFKQYLEKLGVNKITINNIEPQKLSFNQTIETAKLPEKFNTIVKTTMAQNYIESEVSLYMMTELAEIFEPNNENSFSLILDRSYDIAIFGTLSKSFVGIFNKFKIQDVRSYLSSIMLSYFTEDFDNKIIRNYF